MYDALSEAEASAHRLKKQIEGKGNEEKMHGSQNDGWLFY